MSGDDAVELTGRLVRVDSAAGGERLVIDALAGWLPPAHRVQQWRPGRWQLTGRWPGERPMTFAAHLDTVPADATAWSVDPWGGEVVDGRLYGRGSSDMKSGLAAFLVAVREHVAEPHRCAGVQLVLTAAEETGCEGAAALDLSGLVSGGPLLVGEMTDNRLVLGHKGAAWLELRTRGRSAHGSRPDLGDNAAVAMAGLVLAVQELSLPVDPVLGPATQSLGTLRSGLQTNIVPDEAVATLDVRTVPGFTAADAVLRVHGAAGAAGTTALITTVLDLAPVVTAADHPVAALVAAVTGPADGPATYFTDASVLSRKLDASATVVLGPGQIDQAHAVDEYCPVAAIEEGSRVYRAVLDRWCAPPSPTVDP